jgi:N-acetylmuramoyl-L-alanine amidase
VYILPLVFILIIGFILIRNIRGNADETVSRPPNMPNNAHGQDPDNAYVSILRQTHDKIVWLDAGHGGIDGGTQGTVDGVTYFEKDIALNIVLMVHEMFENSDSGVTAFLLRDKDEYVHWGERPAIWNDSADLTVSVHLDFFEGESAQQVSGVQVNFFDDGSGTTGRLNITRSHFAQILQDHLVRETGARDRRIRGDREFTVCVRSTMPAVLIEAGFMSNDAELRLLVTDDYQRSIARAIYNGIVEAFNVR